MGATPSCLMTSDRNSTGWLARRQYPLRIHKIRDESVVDAAIKFLLAMRFPHSVEACVVGPRLPSLPGFQVCRSEGRFLCGSCVLPCTL